MRSIFVVMIINLCFFSSSSFARNDINNYSIKQALNSSAATGKLNDIQLFFGEQPHSKVLQKKGITKVNKKTNAFNKSDEKACEWVFLSAIIALQKNAQKNGANAIINIKSNYQNNLTSNNETFKCGAGTFVAGVALTGELVTIK